MHMQCSLFLHSLAFVLMQILNVNVCVSLLQLSPGNFVCIITFYFYHGFKIVEFPLITFLKLFHLKDYLSLPEGAASSAGLIAMMTDHYNILVSYLLLQVSFLYV